MSDPYSLLASAIDMNHPGRYLHWSIFTLSVANLVLIAVMVLVFGLALLVRFPRERTNEAGGAAAIRTSGNGSGAESGNGQARNAMPLADVDGMWTARIRAAALTKLPPAKLLPDRQPAYVASWVYVFGVAGLAALAMAIASGFVIAVGGTDWWHTDAVGHFFNSLHLWSVELFMALIVIHLWGKFWMAAWRGKRALTWITGGVAFLAAVIECFTGYLSQQNFDSQWIATNGKDAINATGIGAFFNLMNFGQMLLWHVVLIPVLLVALVGGHILLVRMRGVARPLPSTRERTRAERRATVLEDAREWRGPTRRYDIVKEGVAAVTVVTVLVFLLAGILSSPDVPSVTVKTWAQIAPGDFLGTAASELAGTSKTASYGPPYTGDSSAAQRIGISWQALAGTRQPIDTAQTFVISPLTKESSRDPALVAAIARYTNARPSVQQAWDNAYVNTLQKATFSSGQPALAPGDYGPVAQLMSSELTLARSGALDADLLAQHQFYGTNFTKPLLFLEDGSYFSSVAQAQHLTGSQWGVMNETGSYPGQPWLWLYTLWYQIPGTHFSGSANIDLIAVYLTGAATLLLLAIPFVPGLRDIPRWVPVHRMVWRDWYRSEAQPLRRVPKGPQEPPAGMREEEPSYAPIS